MTGVVDIEAVDRCSHADDVYTVQDVFKANYNEDRRDVTHLPQWPLGLALRVYGYIRSQDCIKQYAAMAVADPTAGAHILLHVINDHAVYFPHGAALAFALHFVLSSWHFEALTRLPCASSGHLVSLVSYEECCLEVKRSVGARLSHIRC